MKLRLSFILESGRMFFLPRALLTKCVVEGEVGKILSLLALMQAFMPTVGITTMRVVYNATVDDFAGAFYLVASSSCSSSSSCGRSGEISCLTDTERPSIVAENQSGAALLR